MKAHILVALIITCIACNNKTNNLNNFHSTNTIIEDSTKIKVKYNERIVTLYKNTGQMSVIQNDLKDTSMYIVSVFDNNGSLIKKFRKSKLSDYPVDHYYEYFTNGQIKNYRYYSNYEKNNVAFNINFNDDGTIISYSGDLVVSIKKNANQDSYNFIFPDIYLLRNEISIFEYSRDMKKLLLISKFVNAKEINDYTLLNKDNSLRFEINLSNNYYNERIYEEITFQFPKLNSIK